MGVDRRLLLVLAWAACAVLAAGLGFGAASLVGDAIGDTPTASADTPVVTVTTGPSTPTSTPRTSSPRTSAAPSSPAGHGTTRPAPGTSRTTAAAPTVRTGSRSTAGGVVVATCRSGLVKVSPSPAPGWRLDSWTTGSVATADVEFRNGTSKVEVHVRCGSSGPVFSVETGTDAGGGDDGGGSGDGGGGTSGGSDPSGGSSDG